MKVEAAFWDDSGVQRLTTDQQAGIRAGNGGPIAAFGAVHRYPGPRVGRAG